MIPVVIFIAIIAIAVLIYLKNKVENRRIDRRNKLIEKQEELIEMLREKNMNAEEQ